MINRKMALFVAVALALTAWCRTACADPVRFDIRWSGASFNNLASAAGFVVIDAPDLENGLGVGIELPDPRVLDLRITVTGASKSNGTFTLGNYDSMDFYTPTPLDLTRELIGQPLGNGFTFGPAPTSEEGGGDGNSGDFNFFSSDPSVPSGFWFFKVAAPGPSGGDGLAITSIVAHAIPEPASWVMLALGALVLMRRSSHAKALASCDRNDR